MTKFTKTTSFPTAVMALAALATVLMVAFGYATAVDSATRTQFIVHGLEVIVEALAVAAMAHWAYAIAKSAGWLGKADRSSSGSMSSSA